MPSILPHPKNSQKAADVIIKNLKTSITSGGHLVPLLNKTIVKVNPFQSLADKNSVNILWEKNNEW